MFLFLVLVYAVCRLRLLLVMYPSPYTLLCTVDTCCVNLVYFAFVLDRLVVRKDNIAQTSTKLFHTNT